MKAYLAIILLVVIGCSSCSMHYRKKGNAYYQTMQYDKAISSYRKTTKHTPESKTRLAHSYRLINDYKNAEECYASLSTTPETEPINHFYYGKMLMNNGKYKEAKKSFLNYLVLNDHDPLAEALISSCDSCNNFYENASGYSVKPVEIPELTTAFAQVRFADGIVFAGDKEKTKKKSGWTGRSYLDLYYSYKNPDGTWTKPEALQGSINGPYHEGPAVFSKDGKKVYFTRSNYSSSKKLKKNQLDESNLMIYSAELVEGEWTNLRELPFNSDEYSCGHPALSPDEKTLYFISDMPNGKGGTDLYKVEASCSKDNTLIWSAPQNLGAKINTPGNEMFPYIHSSGTLYFSSDGGQTLGGLDIFSSSPKSGDWETPQNLRYPINSPKDDFSFVLDENGEAGYISSNRDTVDKIYEISLNEPEFVLKGKVLKKEDGNALLDAVVEVTTNTDNYIQVLSTDDFGHYYMKLKPGVEYKIQGLKDDYLKPEIITISTEKKKKSEIFHADFMLEKMSVGKTFILENIYYDLDKWDIRKDAAAELSKFADLLKANPGITIEMNSHTDSRANDNYNQWLSERRAKAAVEYLIGKGIDPNRLKWKGFGESNLVNKCGNGAECPEEQHQANRRTEFKIVDISGLATGNR